jgi:hypothetical protein
LNVFACGNRWAAASTAFWFTSQSTTTFSSGCGAAGAVPPCGGRPGVNVSSLRLVLARPPHAMNAMFSLSLRFRPRSSAGAPASAPAAAKVVPTNSRRVIRRWRVLMACHSNIAEHSTCDPISGQIG